MEFKEIGKLLKINDEWEGKFKKELIIPFILEDYSDIEKFIDLLDHLIKCCINRNNDEEIRKAYLNFNFEI